MKKRDPRDFSRSLSSLKKQALGTKPNLYPIDESEEFYDPFSDLSLFLSKRIRSFISSEESPFNWSKSIERRLFDNIMPEFQEKFPRYRLGASALKKTWEKVHFYQREILREKEALLSDGTLNIPYMIRENLARAPLPQASNGIQPYNYSHQLAINLSECIATFEGKRSKLDELTKIIWACQKHLLPSKNIPKHTPLDDYESLDKLIIRNLLTITSKEPLLPQEELAKRIEESIISYKSIEQFNSPEDLTITISALTADRLYPHLSLHTTLPPKNLEKIEQFLTNQIQRCKEQKKRLTRSQKANIVSRILTLYPLAAGTPKDVAEKHLDQAIKYVYSLSTNVYSPMSPMVNPGLFAFINSEIISLKEKKEVGALEKVLQTLVSVFEEAEELPKLSPPQRSELEIWIWKLLEESEGFTAKIPSDTKSLIEKEIAQALVQQDALNFRELVYTVDNFFKKIRELPLLYGESGIDLDKIRSKIYIWSIQNEMLCHNLEFDRETSLLKILLENYSPSRQETIEISAKQLFKMRPFLSSVQDELKTALTILYKYIWYKVKIDEDESPYQRFLTWHENHHENLQKVSERLLPLTPFPKHQYQSAFCSTIEDLSQTL